MLTLSVFYRNGDITIRTDIVGVSTLENKVSLTYEWGSRHNEMIDFDNPETDIREIRVFDRGQKLMSVRWNGIRKVLDIYDASGNRLGEHRGASSN